MLGQCFQYDNSHVVLALLHKGIGKANLEMNIFGGEGQRFPKLSLRKLGPPLRSRLSARCRRSGIFSGERRTASRKVSRALSGLNANSRYSRRLIEARISNLSLGRRLTMRQAGGRKRTHPVRRRIVAILGDAVAL